MYEEVPQVRRGLGRLSAFRVVLGPFAIGGGVLLATVGGSVAVAATVITASSIATSDVPARPVPTAVATSSDTPHSSRATAKPAAVPPAPGTVGAIQPGNTSAHSSAPTGSSSPSQVAGSLVRPRPSQGRPSGSGTPAATGSPTPSSSGPAGNALIFITGYDQSTERITFQYAEVQRGAGSNGSDVYLVTNPAQFSAAIATGIRITSGGLLCPPAGSSCTVAQLIAAAGDGLFANVAIDPAARLESIIEVDNTTSPTAQASPSPSQGLAAPPAASSSPSPSAVPSPTG